VKYADEFRDRAKAEALGAEIRHLVAAIAPEKPIAIMEVCGGHTH
jgi:hydrogenase expression/formation protein HypD